MQPIKSDIPTEPLPLSCCGSACWYRAESTPVESYDGQICVVESAAGGQREDSPQASSQSVGKMDPRAPVWARRKSGEKNVFVSVPTAICSGNSEQKLNCGSSPKVAD
ncbi:hypothetical protein ACQJBY_069767 [Aegilops geniculata]